MTPTSRPAIQRTLNIRHVRALNALRNADGNSLSTATLEKAIGGYATNTIKSLEQRGYIRRLGERAGGIVWELTATGKAAV